MEVSTSAPGRARPSLFAPQALEEDDLAAVPAPPPLASRPQDASSKNLEIKLDVMEALVKQMDRDGVDESGSKKSSKRPTLVTRAPVEIPVPSSNTPTNELHEQQQAVICPLPKHSLEAIMDHHTDLGSLVALTTNRLAVQMESVLFTQDSIKRAMGWLPSSGDIIVSASPRCGQSLAVLMVRMLCARNEAERKEIISCPLRTAPWIECALTDEDPLVLERDQPGTNRIFRTAMSHSMLSPKMDKVPEAKFIFVARNPLDLRVAWFDHLRSFFVKHQTALERGSNEANWKACFKQQYSVDDIIDTPVTIVQNTAHTADGLCEYEFNIKQWINDTRHKNILIIFLEEILSKPEATIRKIAGFLGKDLTDDEFEHILGETTGHKVLQVSRRNSQALTPNQVSFIQAKFGSDSSLTEEKVNDDEPRDQQFSPKSEAKSRAEMLREMFESSNSSRNISARGIFTEISTRKIDTSGRRTEVAKRNANNNSELQRIGVQQSLAPRSFELLLQRWADIFQSAAPTYEDLYESMVKAPYPSIHSSELLAKRGKRVTKYYKTGEGSTSPDGPRRTLVGSTSPDGQRRTIIGRIFRTEQRTETIDENPGNDQGIFSKPPMRSTLSMKLFGRVSNLAKSQQQ